MTTATQKKTELPSFTSLGERFYLSAELVTMTGLRVGAGKRSDMAATDQPVIRDSAGRPFIPGSSLKGAMRSWLEKILRNIDRKPNLWACDLFDKKAVCGPKTRQGEDANNKPSDEDVRASLCTACSLFGSTHYAGRVYFRDLRILTDPRHVELRDGVGIDRVLGTASPGIKYDTEVVSPGSRFELNLIAENLDPLRRALLVMTFQRLVEGEIALGGMTTRGLGQIQLEKLELKRTSAANLLSGKAPEDCDWNQELETAMRLLETEIAQPGGARHASS